MPRKQHLTRLKRSTRGTWGCGCDPGKEVEGHFVFLFMLYICSFALFTHNFSNCRQIVVMMGTVVIFFFACLLPFKVAHWYWILSYRILIILGDDVMFDDVKINFKIQLLQGADHVGCYFSVWDYGHFQHRGILQPELWNRKKRKSIVLLLDMVR